MKTEQKLPNLLSNGDKILMPDGGIEIVDGVVCNKNKHAGLTKIFMQSKRALLIKSNQEVKLIKER